ncbi:MAG: hypothetical protein ACLRFR_00830 [Clostridia bacterium]
MGVLGLKDKTKGRRKGLVIMPAGLPAAGGVGGHGVGAKALPWRSLARLVACGTSRRSPLTPFARFRPHHPFWGGFFMIALPAAFAIAKQAGMLCLWSRAAFAPLNMFNLHNFNIFVDFLKNVPKFV